jgi:DNA-binding response OmpR family regulator
MQRPSVPRWQGGVEAIQRAHVRPLRTGCDACPQGWLQPGGGHPLTNAEVPIVFLTAKSQTEDRIAGFKAGGDDYLTKPFSHEELALRIEAILRRTHGRTEDPRSRERFELGAYTFDHRNLILSHPTEERKLTKKEAEVLRLLCMHQDQVLPRELVLEHGVG